MRLQPEGLKRALAEMGISNEELADRLGVRVETVYHWVKGKTRMPGRAVSSVNRMLREHRDALATGDG